MKQWYALRSKPKKESLAATLLERAGIEVYIPRMSVHKREGKRSEFEPLFPCYLFARLAGALGEVRLASYTRGVAHILGYGNMPYPVPDNLILAIKERLSLGSGLTLQDAFHPGDRVVVASGPLQGIEAIFDRHLSRIGRVQVLIQILERIWRAELDIEQLRRVN